MEKILLFNEIEQIEKYIDKYSIDHIINGQIDKFESHAKFNLLSFDWYDIDAAHEIPSQIIIHFSEKNIFFICENERTIYRIVCDTSIGKYQGPRVESHSDPIHMKGKENTIYDREERFHKNEGKEKKENKYISC